MMKLKHNLLKYMIGASVFAPISAFAANDAQCKGIQAVSQGVSDPCGGSSLAGSIDAIINTLFIVVGALTVIIMIVGGIRYITSTGDSGRIQKAKDTILYAIIGLVVVILARAIVGFVIGRVG